MLGKAMGRTVVLVLAATFPVACRTTMNALPAYIETGRAVRLDITEAALFSSLSMMLMALAVYALGPLTFSRLSYVERAWLVTASTAIFIGDGLLMSVRDRAEAAGMATLRALHDTSFDSWVAWFYVSSLLYVLVTQVRLALAAPRAEGQPVREEPRALSTLAAWRATSVWMAVPVSVSSAATALTYVLSGYEASVVNHATVFGVYLALAVVVQDKLQQSRHVSGQ